jgi:hypothetical protein
MAFESITTDQISDLLNCTKVVANANSREKLIEGREQYTYKATATDGSGHEFEIYKRQNSREGMEDDFSCGITWLAPNGETLTLKRYNGPSHNHPNHLENGEKLGLVCHIHIASEKYIKANRKPEGFAIKTDKYRTLDGAFQCLVEDCRITGFNNAPDDQNQIGLPF